MRSLSFVAILLVAAGAPAASVTFLDRKAEVPVFEPFECVTETKDLNLANPFADATFTAAFTTPGGKTKTVAGFCDAADGTTYRLRFLPLEPGVHKYTLKFERADGNVLTSPEHTLTVTKDAKARGMIGVDTKHPHHFVWGGTGEHYFWNGTTTYWLLGVQDDQRIAAAIDRLAKLKVNRIRVALNARTKDGSRWFEPQVTNSKDFQFRVDPWVAKNKDSVDDPQFDTSRFNLSMWQKLDKLVEHARKKGVVVSIIFHLDGPDKGVDPFNGGKKKGEGYADYTAEERYYRYGVARLAGFSNVMWDVTNEWHLFRDEKWVNHFGALVHLADPFGHLTSVHGRGDFPFYQSSWADFAMYQVWDENGAYKFMRKARDLATKASRPMPQVNEEYGYEDHYPGPWGGGRKKPARSADSRRRLAWEMAMAGGYQTTGERADEPGHGGWITGLGNDKMTMLDGYAHLVDFFTAFEWWKCDPVDDLADNGALVLAEAGKRYVVYAPKGGTVTLKLPAAEGWTLTGYNPRTGATGKPAPLLIPDADGRVTLTFADTDDWAAVIQK
jgi:Domain of unknown function (DUF5060)/Protein of unknown function (DUF4038)